MTTLKLNDLCFYGDDSSSKYHKSKHIIWDRTIGEVKDREPVFFTDSCLQMASMDIFKLAYKIAWLIEPPVIRQDTYQFVQQNHSVFDLILTHQLTFNETIPNAKYAPGSMSWVAEEDWKKYDKSKNISIIASDKNYAPGHVLRHQLIKSYDINNRPFDVYGSCTGKFLPHKIDALRDYRYTVVIENCQTNGYFTEKLIDAFATYTIPIYWGCPNIGDYFNIEGIAVCRTLDELREAITVVNSNPEAGYEYVSPEAMQENFILANRYKVAEDYIYENILTQEGLI